jgi:hypothetical protein
MAHISIPRFRAPSAYAVVQTASLVMTVIQLAGCAYFLGCVAFIALHR